MRYTIKTGSLTVIAKSAADAIRFCKRLHREGSGDITITDEFDKPVTAEHLEKFGKLEED